MHAAGGLLFRPLVNSYGGFARPNATSSSVGGGLVQGVGEGGIAALDSGNCGGLLLADDVAGSALSIGGELAVDFVVTV